MTSPQRVCPNPSCPYAAKHGAAARFRAGTAVCNDCGTALVDEATPAEPTTSAAPATPAASAPASDNARAIAVSLAAAAMFPLLQHVPAPFVDTDMIAQIYGRDFSAFNPKLGSLSIAAMSFAPFVTAALLVELVAVAVPALRPMRHDARRARLVRATYVLGVVAAFLQATVLVRFIEALAWHGESVLDAAPVARPALALTFVAGSCISLAVVEVVRRFGVGNGWTLLASGAIAWQLVCTMLAQWNGIVDGSAEPMAGIVALSCVAAPAFIAWRLVKPFDDVDHPDPAYLPRPMTGLIPVQAAFLAPSLFAFAASTWDVPLDRDIALALGGLAGIASAPICAAAFSQNANANAKSRAWPATAVLIVIAFASSLLASRLALPVVDGIGIASLVAVIVDVGLELRARGASGSLTSVAARWRFADAARDIAKLDGAGIRAVPRGAHYRALFHFFAPLVPLEVLVPVDDVERAREVLSR